MLRDQNTDWRTYLEQEILHAASGDSWRQRYAEANAESTRQCVAGGGQQHGEAGARVVFNIAAVHVPGFCERSRSNDSRPYFNCYNLGSKTARIGSDMPTNKWKKRERVDFMLMSVHHKDMENVYFAAMEINGAGVHFYGDFCLVLKPDAVDAETVVLDRNSFDLDEQPLLSHIVQCAGRGADSAAISTSGEKVAEQISGRWAKDAGDIAATKLIETRGCPRRRMTIGQISSAVRDDEDYIEVLKIGSFGAAAIEAVRLSAEDVALEHHIEQRIASSTPPSHVAQLWLEQRRAAVKDLREIGVAVEVVTHLGRSRT